MCNMHSQFPHNSAKDQPNDTVELISSITLVIAV